MHCFDFCYTIVNMNTTFTYVDYCVGRLGFKFKVKLFLVKLATKLLLMFGLISKNSHSKLRISVLKSVPEADLRKYSREFSVIIESRLYCSIYDLLVNDDLNNVVVVSNAIDFLIIDFFDHVGLDVAVIASSLKFFDGCFSGDYEVFLPETGKSSAFKNAFPEAAIKEFYTDDLVADSDLVRISDRTFTVVGGFIV